MRKVFVLWLMGMLGAWAEVKEDQIEHAGATFRVVRLEPRQVRLVWKGGDGQPMRTFDRVQAQVAKEGKTVKFAMNGGIFEMGGIPSGFYAEQGKVLQPFNHRDAPGNFFLKPNGAVGYTGGKAFVATTVPNKVDWAVQSGPMLLIDGKRHPAFKEGSANKLHRNGVGVDTQGRIVFAITAKGQLVNLWDFAGLFLKLDCSNALFLDGDISQMVVNPKAPVASNSFASIFVVAE